MQLIVDVCVYSFLVIMFSLNGVGSSLSCDIFPPIELEGNWELGLINFMTYNSIPNVEENVNNMFYFGDDGVIALPTGSYEIEDINTYINQKLPKSNKRKIIKLLIRANNNTLKSEIYSSETIDFTKPNSLASLLGFANTAKLEPLIWHSSQSTINIVKTDVVRLVCSAVVGSLKNGRESHILHEFYPTVGPGYKLVESPTNVIYLPVNTNRLDNITIRLEDQDGKLINFREETISLRLHIRKRRDEANFSLWTK